MHVNAEESVNRAYARFKEVVASGRIMDEGHLDTIAGGRVWTGEQAKHNGLIDEIGGLQRAIAYARRTYTEGDAKVELYGEDDDRFAKFRQLIAKGVTLLTDDQSASNHQETSPLEVFPPFLAMTGEARRVPFALPNRAFDLFLTSDENAAIWSFISSNDTDSSSEA